MKRALAIGAVLLALLLLFHQERRISALETEIALESGRRRIDALMADNRLCRQEAINQFQSATSGPFDPSIFKAAVKQKSSDIAACAKQTQLQALAGAR